MSTIAIRRKKIYNHSKLCAVWSRYSSLWPTDCLIDSIQISVNVTEYRQ